MNTESLISSNNFLEILVSIQPNIESLSHLAKPIYGDIFRFLEKESKTVNGRIESKVLMCVDPLMTEMKAKDYLREIYGNVSAFEVHKNSWFQVQIVTNNISTDEGCEIDNIRRNKFMLILRSLP